MNMSEVKILTFKPDPCLATQTLGSKYYKTICQPPTEIVINGCDGAFRDKRPPIIKVQIYKKHPVTDSTAISFTDNGVGFTPEVLEAYGTMGKSRRIGHGRHGVGRFSAFALCADNENPQYFIITAVEGETDATLIHVNGKKIFDGGFVGQTIDRNSYPDLPATGSFTTILVPNWHEGFTAAELIDYLTMNLPSTPWQVTVNGVEVPHRTLNILVDETLPKIEGIPGQVRISLGRNDDTKMPDSLYLVDSLTGRPIARLTDCKGIRLNPILRNPALIGNIAADGLEDWSTGDRDSIRPDFWRTEYGAKLTVIIDKVVVSKARSILGNSDTASVESLVKECLSSLGETFSAHWGHPDIVQNETPEDENDDEDEESTTTRKPSGNGGKPSGGTKGGGHGSKGSSGGKKKHRPDTGDDSPDEGVFIRIETETYQILTYESNSVLPAEVRSGRVMVINTRHPAVAPHLKTNRLREVMLRIIVEAHVASAYADEPNLFAPCYRILGVIGA